MKRIIAAATLAAVISTPALAWGPREQGAVLGIAGYWLYQKLDEAGKPKGPPVQYQQPPVVIMQQPPVQSQPQSLPQCRTEATYNQTGEFLGYQLWCRQQ
jgi:hypothetical protein